jgi:hypothetical protein
VRVALVLGLCEERYASRVSLPSGRIVDRQPGVVTDIGTRELLEEVFVPVSDDI